MFHRRAADFIRKRDWAGMGFELVVVAMGVLLGIEASNWNERRVRAERQREVMKQLTTELDATVTEADQRTEAARTLVANLAIVRAAVDSGRLDPRQSKQFNDGMCQSLAYSQPAWRLSTVDQLISSGNLDLIADPQLRAAFVGYRDTVQTFRGDISQFANDAVARWAPVDPYVDYKSDPNLVAAKGEADLKVLPNLACKIDLAAIHADPAARHAIKFIENRMTNIFVNQLLVGEGAKKLRAAVLEKTAR